ncbi:metal ABC transporter permease [Gardnerella vaginalis]|uniref:metal ABC transporter permease n=1 Tax=Gardnerella TaxID=2701 RepID=UPI00020D7698|nr:metal ABC transporter permease [Gardnerella vaginalis]EGL13684.1 ABC 3 transport family protein [Gardnerella vaginalis 315-A]NSX23841.1 metal ABC transporter permease [Gardnerella vaginalis]PKZ57065.1 metal ABC transporter permease [Gardnerella vaginalis]PKZ74052.1 metal ABC transporter permease [Gardnerella vaginalis]UQA83603.1 metal ABC transporter permease [Gardnerella vaginalis]
MLAELVESLRKILEPIPGFDFIASAPYIFRPFCLLIVLAIASGIVGVFVNLRCAEFNAEALVHGIFPGIVVGALYGGIGQIIPGASICAIFLVAALVWASRSQKINESIIATVLTTFFALGIVISLKKGDMSGQLEALMFGRLLDVTDDRMTQAMLICLFAIVLLVLTWKKQIVVAFDRASAPLMGVNTLLVDIVLNVAIASVVVSASSAVGVLLVIGYLVIPGASARLVSRTVGRMAFVGVAVGIFGVLLGMYAMNLELDHPVSPQAAVALSICAMFVVVLILRFLYRVTYALVFSKKFSKKKKSSAIDGGGK